MTVATVRPSSNFIERHQTAAIGLVLTLGLLIRLPFVHFDFRSTADVEIFQRWIALLQADGLRSVYSQPGVNYPPFSMLMFYAAAKVDGTLGPLLPAEQRAGLVVTLIKLPSMLADVLAAGLVAVALAGVRPRARVLAAACYVFNPAVWYVSAYWGQIDALHSLFLLAAVVALDRGHSVGAWLTWMLALASKQISIALLPLVAVASALSHHLARGCSAALGLAALLTAPWWASGRLGELASALTAPLPGGRLIDVTAYNLWYLLLLGDVRRALYTEPAWGLPFNYLALALTLFLLSATAAMFGFVRRREVYLAGAVLSLAPYMLLTQMRERYLFPALALLLVASIRRPRLQLAYAALTATYAFNLATIAPFTDLLGINLIVAEPVTGKVVVLKALAVLAAAVNTATLAWLLAECILPDADGRLLRRWNGGPAGGRQ